MVVPSTRKLLQRNILQTNANVAKNRLYGPNPNLGTNRDRLILLEAEIQKRRQERKQGKQTRSISKIFKQVEKLDPLTAKRLRRMFSNNGVHDVLGVSSPLAKRTTRTHHISKLEAVRKLPNPKLP